MATFTATQLEAVAATIQRLQTALQHARSTKQVTTVDPPLTLSSIDSAVDHLLDDIDEKHDQSYKFAAVETAARDIFYSLITSSTIDEPEFVEVWNLLDILLLGGDRGKCAPELVVWLIEELLDSQTTEGCKTVFDYLESRRERLAQKDFHKKNLVFLRSCNELLRRLSRAEDASFCGRVFFFLFQTFPLGDKSSVNLRGEFHIENTTTFDETVSTSTSAPESQVEASSEPTDGTSTPASQSANGLPARPGSKPIPAKSSRKQAEEEPIDNNTLYPIFWRLQQSFSEPTGLFKPAQLQSFKTALSTTIARFRKIPIVAQASAATQRTNGLKRKADNEGSDLAENYNPKYLTSRDLFDLELSDQAFQRHILVQGLILISFLLSLTERAKKKLLAVEHPNKSLLYDFTLNAEDARWAIDTSAAIIKIFKETTEGCFYERMVNTILARDRNWVRWKIESCPSIVRDSVSTDEVFDARSKTQRAAKSRRVDTRAMGSMDLDFLQNDQSGGLDALREPDKYTAPDTAQLVTGVKMTALDLEMAMDDEEKVSLESTIQNKTWRAIRSARALELTTLARYDPSKDLEQVFVVSNSEEANAINLAA